MTEFEIHTLPRGTGRMDMVFAVNHGYGPRGETDLIGYTWLIEGTNHLALLDPGPPQDDKKLRAMLEDRGVGVEDIDSIIVSHLHVGHNGGSWDRFPNATVHLQQAELTHALNPTPQHRESSSSVDGPMQDALHEIVDMKQPQELSIHRDDFTLTEGLEVWRSPGHTPGFQTPIVETEKGTVGLYKSKYYTNWFPGDPTFHPPGVEFEHEDWFDISSVGGFYPEGVGTESTWDYLDEMQRVADRCDIVVPGHDPFVPEKLPDQWYFTDIGEPRVSADEKKTYFQVREHRYEAFDELEEW